MVRERFRYVRAPSGSWHFRNDPGTGDPGSDTTIGWEGVEDVVEPGDCGPFNLNRSIWDGGRISSTADNTTSVFNQYRCGWVSALDGFASSHLSTPDDGILDYATETMRRTNPSRPLVDVVTAIAELRELPDLLKGAGDRWVERLARTNLKYQFGVKPIISDLVKSLDFIGSVEQRIRELNKLASPKGLRKTTTLHTGRNQASVPAVFHSLGTFVSGLVIKDTKRVVRGHARWVYQFGYTPSPEQQYRDARAAVLGLTVDFVTVWNLLPWSWFYDWCGNLGDFLSAHRNIVGADCTKIAIMQHTESKSRSVNHSVPSGYIMTPISCVHETKTRALASASLNAHLPFLDGRQLGILASIGVLRR